MFNEKITLSGSSLALLRIGEQGTITRLRKTNEPLFQKLSALGLAPGVSIKLEQRSPNFIIKVGNHQLTLDKQIAHSVYVRLCH